MTVSEFLIVRIIPTRPVTATAFRAALNKITITASDKTVFSAGNDRELGKASGLADEPTDTVAPVPPLKVIAGEPPTLQPSIIQHFTIRNNVLGEPELSMASTATAVIVINRAGLTQPDKEYPTPTSYDVSLALTQDSTEPTVASRQQVVDFNVRIASEHLDTDQLSYISRAAEVYLSIDVPQAPLDSGTAIYAAAADGTPPSFTYMVKAIDNVLGKDSPTGATSLEDMKVFLSTAQARQVAAELVNNRLLDPPPTAPYPSWDIKLYLKNNVKVFFEDMFTVDTPGGKIKEQTTDQSRTKFEGDRASYYALRTSDGIQLANYVYSAIFAIYAEFYSFNAKRAVITIPVEANAQHSTSVSLPSLSISGTNGAALDPSFTVPAAYFYALTTTHAITQDFDTRMKILLTASSDTLANSLGLAIDQGVLGRKSSADGLIWRDSSLESVPAVHINELQAIRRITALQASVRNALPEQVQPAANASVKKMIIDWLQYIGTDADLPRKVWYRPENAKEYLTVILEVIAPGDETLISTILTDLRLPPESGTGLGLVIQNVTDLSNVTEAQWLEFFQRHEGLLPRKYLLGDLKGRVHTLVQDVTKVLFTLPAPQSLGDLPPQLAVPTLAGTLDKDVLVNFLNQSKFSLTDDLDSTKLAQYKAQALQIFKSEQIASFVTSAVQELWTLYRMTDLTGISKELRFSYMEALHARGFTSAEKVKLVGSTQFPLAMVGTVAFPRAGDIFTKADELQSDSGNSDPEPGYTFNPVNSGDLTNCEPPCHLSPFGPFQYLKQLLGLPCGAQTVGDVLATRRGPLSNLIVNASNLDTQLPVVDIVNENLESLVADLTANSGAIHNTDNAGLTSIDVQSVAPLVVPAGLTEDGILKALPQHSSPHLPQDQPGVYTALASSVAGPDLPYSQSLDISRNYLSTLGTSRFDVMRVFHRDTTEFAPDASKEPAEFQKSLWRLPVRYDIALEYLRISPEEASSVYGGKMTSTLAMELLGVPLHGNKESSTRLLQVSSFMSQAGITYCEFLELYKSGFVQFDAGEAYTDYPECLPCCEEAVVISFPGERSQAGELLKLLIFIRLWKSLRRPCGERVTMNVLADICKVLKLFTDTNVNPDFLRQLASLLMLRDFWSLPWAEKKATASQDDQPDARTTLLSIWSGKGTETDGFQWSVEAIFSAIEKHAGQHYKCLKRSASWKKLIASNLDDLAELAGFIESKWYSTPTCTIRFVEILTKLYASNFTVGEIFFLFTTRKHLRADDPFPFTEDDESLDDPFNVSEDDEKYGLWALRRKLLHVEVCDEEAECWSWQKIESTLEELGYHAHEELFSLQFLGEHFFPDVLEECGCDVSHKSRYFTTTLRNSSPQIWYPINHCSPFSYQSNGEDRESAQLRVKLPLRDEDVLKFLRDTRQLNPQEASAAQTLYWQTRAALAPFALLFTNFNHAAEYMVQEPCVRRRFHFFQREVAKFEKRCKVIARHLHNAVHSATESDDAECECADGHECDCTGMKAAWRILLSLIADENEAFSAWEDPSDAGAPPTNFQWDFEFSGGAFAALLGLIGTGIEGSYSGSDSSIVWKELRGGLSAWGDECNYWNTPIPTVLPDLSLQQSDEQSTLISFKNGFALDQETGRILSGGEPFTVVWKGELMVEKGGCYHFGISCNSRHHRDSHDSDSPHGDRSFCDCDCEDKKQWAVKLQRGEKNWTLLSRGPNAGGVPEIYSKQVPLRPGAYRITIVYRQPEPDFDDDDDLSKFHTGVRISYKGPDTHECPKEVPVSALYIQSKDGPLWPQNSLMAGSTRVINSRYIPTLRDIRRTYQRAFKSVLFAHRFCLSACLSHCEGESELGYLLSNQESFQGTSYYWDAETGTYKVHHATFNFNFLPVTDAYLPPSVDDDQRVQPSEKRQTALFDWFERIFDYTVLRSEVRSICEPALWIFFHHVTFDSPQRVDQLLRYLGVEIKLAPLVLEYFAPPPDGLFKISDSQNLTVLGDERWATRAWKAKRWLDHVQRSFYAPIIELALCRPALWSASPDPNAPVDGLAGNINLTRFVQRSCLGKTDAETRLREVVGLSNGLRHRARHALLQFLRFNGKSAEEISDYLLLDVFVDIGETTTRVNDLVDAAQRFVQRAILGLEAEFLLDAETLKRWECEFSTFEKWQARQRRLWYNENWLQWDEAKKWSKSEGYQSLDKALVSGITTVATLAENMNWDGTSSFPAQPGKEPLPSAQASVLQVQRQALDEGLSLMGRPDRSAMPTWLAPVQPINSARPPERNPNPPGGGPPRFEAESPDENSEEADAIRSGDGEGEPSPTTITPTSLDESLPGASSLKSIPLWVQAALRLGVRFIRVAASSVPIALPYSKRTEQPPVCCECGQHHEPTIDEYYFWLEDNLRFDPADIAASQNADLHDNVPGVSGSTGNTPQIDPRTIQADPTSDWDAPTPKMLHWESEPLVHLRWMRVHRGVLQDSRRSTEGIPFADADLDALFLDLRGRSFDSLLFNVKKNDTSTGFRFDIATDTAIPIPEPVPSPPPPALPILQVLVDELAAFPYFLYYNGGMPLVPVGTFGASMVIAASLRTDCRYQAATYWLKLVYDPLSRDNTWMQCPTLSSSAAQSAFVLDDDGSKSSDLFSSTAALGEILQAAGESEVSARAERGRLPQDSTCCRTAPVKHAKATGRAVTMEYVETLIAWADSFRCLNSLEADQQADTLLSVAAKVLGKKPKAVAAVDLTRGKMTLTSFQSSQPPLNPRLMRLFDAVDDGLSMVRAGINKRRLCNGAIGRDRATWGSHRRFDTRSAFQPSMGDGGCDGLCVYSCSQTYRYSSILPKAFQWTAIVKSTGAALLSAIEKADSEALSSIRTAQERQITELSLDISKNQYRAADWDVQALDKQMQGALTRLQYYQKLISDGLNFSEMGYLFGTEASMASRTSANVSDGVGQGMASVPDMWVGVAGVAGSPLQFQQMPMGVKMGTGFAAAARILNTVADISSSNAGMQNTQGGWDRRAQEWQHQCDVITYEIQQIKRQRLAARRRLEVSRRELNNTERRIEHQAEVQDFLRDKFSKYELYLYLQQENSALYSKTFSAAVEVAREAQLAAGYELGDPSLDIIPAAATVWDSLHSGLLAGEKLEVAVQSLDRAYMSKNCREYELAKHISLRLHFPASFVMLKTTGCCEVDIPEWLFDLDYPGHYMRRIKTVSLTIPCVAGPYTGIHCKLQQLQSSIRQRPQMETCGDCCCKGKDKTETAPGVCIHDPAVATRYAGTEAIATSTGQNDSGLFEVSFADTRYLPFEYSGAVSRWRLELPRENNQFDFDSLSDVIIHINFTAREGGPEFQRQRQQVAQKHLPADGLRFFDIRHEMQEAWSALKRNEKCEGCLWKAKCRPGECDLKCACESKSGGRAHGDCDDGRSHRGREHDSHHSGGEEHRKHPHGREVERRRGAHHQQRRHKKRSFELELSRQMFPFATACHTIVVTGAHVLIDIKDCDGDALEVFHMVYVPPHKLADCPDTKKVPFVRTAGGLWRGNVQFAEPIVVPDLGPREARGLTKGSIGTFEVPCELQNVCKAWLLCDYEVLKKEEGCSLQARC
ncbi:hypothetical protein LLEC1_03148 [Akanthomyces lecanii]|uniref:Uncharacterized protein n=1 Tax=Cordyceps confragosa TaxID=2714763 RepID=A0A179IL59_CORDF|nr:hypothetical protein LLEC1_03148 [Akanthomyces lecanii]